MDLTDICFCHTDIDLHLFQITRDLKQGGCLEIGGNGLPDIDVPGDDDTGNG